MEDIIHFHKAKIANVQIKVMIQCVFQTLGLHIEAWFFFYKNTGVTHDTIIFFEVAKIIKNIWYQLTL